MDRIEDCISFIVGKAAQQVTRRARELLAPFGVTPVQYAVLKVLGGDEALSGAEIGKRMVLDSASITGVLDRLESLGLVERRPNPNDRRAHFVAATGAAIDILPDMDAAMDRLNAEAAAVLDIDRDDAFRQLRRIGEWSRHV